MLKGGYMGKILRVNLRNKTFTEESTSEMALGIPCFTIRENTEKPVTIEEGTNTLVGTTAEGILSAFEKFRNGETKKGRIPELWDGHAAERIVDILLCKKAEPIKTQRSEVIKE
jgi:UDP-N-acetylglucosamine 2-epimerase